MDCGSSKSMPDELQREVTKQCSFEPKVVDGAHVHEQTKKG